MSNDMGYCIIYAYGGQVPGKALVGDNYPFARTLDGMVKYRQEVYEYLDFSDTDTEKNQAIVSEYLETFEEARDIAQQILAHNTNREANLQPAELVEMYPDLFAQAQE